MVQSEYKFCIEKFTDTLCVFGHGISKCLRSFQKRHYKVRSGELPGTFRFSVLDNGVTSDEFWTIVGAADDLSWVVFHYAGAAGAVGQVRQTN